MSSSCYKTKHWPWNTKPNHKLRKNIPVHRRFRFNPLLLSSFYFFSLLYIITAGLKTENFIMFNQKHPTSSNQNRQNTNIEDTFGYNSPARPPPCAFIIITSHFLKPKTTYCNIELSYFKKIRQTQAQVCPSSPPSGSLSPCF